MYFADDATLLSDSLAGAEKQLDIAQRYCAASGAKLNINKTTILPLNRTRTQHEPSRLRVLDPSASVRYLGLPISQRVKHSDRLAAIDAKFFPPTSSRPRSLDFLWLPFSRQWFNRNPGRLTAWWADVMVTWQAWTKSLNVETLSPSNRQRLYLTAPIWNNKYPQWRYQTKAPSSKPRPLWKATNMTVRRALANNGFSTLQDFLTPNLRWPTLNEFAATAYCLPELTDPQSRNVTFLYGQLTQIYDRLFPTGIDTTLLATPPARLQPLLPWHAATSLKRHSFPHIPSKVLGRALAAATPEPKTTHPFQRHATFNNPTTTELLDHAKRLRKTIDPRILDVTLRIWWRILPTHYFFWRHKDIDPNRRHCAHGCNQLETYQHLFWTCQHSNELWDLVLRQWRPTLDSEITWTQVLFGVDIPLKTRWRRHSDSLLLVWNITRSIVFTLLWQNRNHRKHRNEPPPDPRMQWHWIDARRRQHIRHELRIAITTDNAKHRDGLIRASALFVKPPFANHTRGPRPL